MSIINNADIFGTGIYSTVKGRVENNLYQGLLFEKSASRSSSFPDNYIVLDVKTLKGELVEDYYSVERFIAATFSSDSLKGEHYLIIENKPLITGGVQPLDDLKGITISR